VRVGRQHSEIPIGDIFAIQVRRWWGNADIRICSIAILRSGGSWGLLWGWLWRLGNLGLFLGLLAYRRCGRLIASSDRECK
jgi:hypothetical protein